MPDHTITIADGTEALLDDIIPDGVDVEDWMEYQIEQAVFKARTDQQKQDIMADAAAGQQAIPDAPITNEQARELRAEDD